MYKITKDEKYVYVEVNIKKRKFTSEKKVVITQKDALAEAKKKYPEIEMSPTNENLCTVSSDTDVNASIWRFPIKIDKKEVKTVEEKEKKLPKKSRKRVNKFSETIFSPKEKPLTPTEEPATLEETSQSDQPAIVQESTE